MIRNLTDETDRVTALVCRVSHRWYICSDIVFYFDNQVKTYIYTSPTLKFKYDLFYNGYAFCACNIDGEKINIDIIGHNADLKLEYL